MVCGWIVVEGGVAGVAGVGLEFVVGLAAGLEVGQVFIISLFYRLNLSQIDKRIYHFSVMMLFH